MATVELIEEPAVSPDNSVFLPNISHLPSHWGPLWWPHVHSVGITFKEATTKDEPMYESYFRGLPATLPCPGCRIHCADYLLTNPPPIAGSAGTDKLWRWTVDFHNAVNRRKEKREFTYEEAENHWMESFNNPQMVLDSARHEYVRKADAEKLAESERKLSEASHKTANAVERANKLDQTLLYALLLLAGFALLLCLTALTC